MNSKINMLKDVELTGVATVFYSQYCQDNLIFPMQEDCKREEVVNCFKKAFNLTRRNPHRLMTIEDISVASIINVAYRNMLFDDVLLRHLEKDPTRDIINIGAGFDTRYFRLDSYKGHFYDIDFKHVIEAKKEMLKEDAQYTMLQTKSAFTTYFLEKEIPIISDNPIFVAEGVMCYIEYHELCEFIKELFEIYPKATLICDVFLYEKHLVLNDVKSKVLLKHPEDGIEKFEKYKKIYAVEEKIKRIFSSPKCQNENLKRIVDIKQMICNQGNVEITYNGEKYKPEYWLGVYEKKGVQ